MMATTAKDTNFTVIQSVVYVSKFLKVTIGLDLINDTQNQPNIRKQWPIKLLRLFWFLVNLQSGLYVLSQLSIPTLIKSFMTSVKGVRSQMFNFTAFTAHTNSSIIGLICHFLLISTMPKTIHQLLIILETTRLSLNSVKLKNLARLSIAGTICIATGV